MSYVPGFKYDVFVSYAHVDNDPGGRDGWVAQFSVDLERSLKQRLGGSDELALFHDNFVAQSANYRIESFEADAKASAVMVSILSPSYVEPHRGNEVPFALREFNAFTAEPKRLKDWFAIQMLPFHPGTPVPEQIHSHLPLAFWQQPRGGAPTRFSRKDDSYAQAVHDLAHHINIRLREMRNGTAPAREIKHTVVLGQVTEDLEHLREQVRRHLEPFGIEVLPSQYYPQGATEFEAAFKADLARSELFIQLIGNVVGRRPPDIPKGYTRLQADLAAESKVPILQWRHQELDLASVSDDDHRELLNGPNVVAQGLESFKAEIVRRLETPKKPERERAAAQKRSLIFVDTDRADRAEAEAIGEAISRQGHNASLPSLSGTAEEIREDLIGNMVDCDGLILVYCKSRPVWVNAQWRLYQKLQSQRQEPARLLGLYIGPPAEKPSIDFRSPDLVQVDCRESFDPSRVHDILAHLQS